MAWGSQCLIIRLSAEDAAPFPHTAWRDIICHLLHLPAPRAIYNNNRSPWYLLIHHNKMSLEIFHFHSPGFLPFFFLFLFPPSPPLASSSFSSWRMRLWPLTPSSVADWALWDANWPCNNTSNRNILPCKMWGETHCGLISAANPYSYIWQVFPFFLKIFFVLPFSKRWHLQETLSFVSFTLAFKFAL